MSKCSTILKTDRLILRPWAKDDAQDLYRYAKDPRIGPMAGWAPHKDVSESLHIIETIFWKSETFAICLRGSNNIIGNIALMTGLESELSLPPDEAEIGFWLGVPFWGQGIVPEACLEVIKYAFEIRGIKKLWCAYFEGNENSKRVQEKCGFKYHRTDNGIYRSQIGDIKDHHISILLPKSQ